MKKLILVVLATLALCSWNFSASADTACGVMGSYLGDGSPRSVAPADDYQGVCNKDGFDYGNTSPLKIADKKVEILVAVNLDEYPNASCRNIEKIIELSQKHWLSPKTGLSFAITDIIYGHLGRFDEKKDNSRYGQVNIYDKFVSDYLRENTYKLPDYAVYFLGDVLSRMHGGHAGGGIRLQPETEAIAGAAYLPGGRVDLTHIYGQCGYDEAGEKIISNVSIGGECKNKPGTPCIKKNGVQICANMTRSFMTADILNMQAVTVVHEFLHSFGGVHFDDPSCAKTMGTEYDSLMANPIEGPFDSKFQEYAGMCPNVFEMLRVMYGVDR